MCATAFVTSRKGVTSSVKLGPLRNGKRKDLEAWGIRSRIRVLKVCPIAKGYRNVIDANARVPDHWRPAQDLGIFNN